MSLYNNAMFGQRVSGPIRSEQMRNSCSHWSRVLSNIMSNFVWNKELSKAKQLILSLENRRCKSFKICCQCFQMGDVMVNSAKLDSKLGQNCWMFTKVHLFLFNWKAFQLFLLPQKSFSLDNTLTTVVWRSTLGFTWKRKKLSTSIDSCCSAFTIETSFLQCKLGLYTNEGWQSPLWKLSLWQNELCAQVRRIYTKIEMLHVTHFMFSQYQSSNVLVSRFQN